MTSLILSGVLIGCCDKDAISTNIRDLNSPTAKERNAAALALARCSGPKVERAVPTLEQLLYDSNVGVQSSAAYALRRIDSLAARRAIGRATEKR